jgi:hypothetical protein
VIYRGHIWFSARELNEAVALGEGVLFLVAAAYAIYWLAQIVKEVDEVGWMIKP